MRLDPPEGPFKCTAFTHHLHTRLKSTHMLPTAFCQPVYTREIFLGWAWAGPCSRVYTKKIRGQWVPCPAHKRRWAEPGTRSERLEGEGGGCVWYAKHLHLSVFPPPRTGGGQWMGSLLLFMFNDTADSSEKCIPCLIISVRKGASKVPDK